MLYIIGIPREVTLSKMQEMMDEFMEEALYLRAFTDRRLKNSCYGLLVRLERQTRADKLYNVSGPKSKFS